jgi:hypothetical protein
LELAADDEDEDVSDASDASNTTIPDKDVVGTNSDVNTNVANNNVTSDIADVNKNATDELDAEAAVANADVAPLPNELGSRKGSHAPPTGLSVSPARSEEAINTFGHGGCLVGTDSADVNNNAPDELDDEAAVANAEVAPSPNELGSRKGSRAPSTGLSVSPARSEEAINTFGRSPARSSAGVSPWCALHSSLLAFRKLALPLLCNRLARLRGVN